MGSIRYNINTNTLETGTLTENASITPRLDQSMFTNELKINGSFIAEPTYVNKVELEPSGNLHAFSVFEDPYQGLDMWYALVVKGYNNINGNNILVDAYDSIDPSFSTNGLYDSTKRKDTADVIGSGSVPIQNQVAVGSLRVYGYIGRQNYNVTESVPSSASVGNSLWVDNGTLGIQPGHLRDSSSYFQDRYVTGSRNGSLTISQSFAPIFAPYTIGFNPTSGIVDGTFYDYILDSSSDYYVTNLSGKIYVSASVNARIVTDNLNMSGTDTIVVHPSASAVQIWAKGPVSPVQSRISGIDNRTKKPKSLIFNICRPVFKVGFTSGTNDYLCIRAPEAEVNIVRSGTGTKEFYGHITGNNILFVGDWNIHFDEHIRRQ